MTKSEKMVLKTVHDLGVAGASDVQNYMGLSANKATRVLDSLANKEYLEIAERMYQSDANGRDKDGITIAFVCALWKLTPKGKKAAKKIPDIDEPLCIPITNIQLEKMEDERTVLTDGYQNRRLS